MEKYLSYTTFEQSNQLAEILPIESADMEYLALKDDTLIADTPFVKFLSKIEDCAYNTTYDKTPCWSFFGLLNFVKNNFYTNFFHDGKCWNFTATHHVNNTLKYNDCGDDPLLIIYKMIVFLHEKKRYNF